jgi:hypothetical protein
MSDIKNNLVEFQIYLNEQFENIEIQKKQENNPEEINLEHSFIVIENSNFNMSLAINLSYLKNTIADFNIQKLYLTKKWISGITHNYGDIFLIVDMFKFLFEQSYKTNAILEINKESKILLLKDIDNFNNKLGLLTENLYLLNKKDYILVDNDFYQHSLDNLNKFEALSKIDFIDSEKQNMLNFGKGILIKKDIVETISQANNNVNLIDKLEKKEANPDLVSQIANIQNKKSLNDINEETKIIIEVDFKKFIDYINQTNPF